MEITVPDNVLDKELYKRVKREIYAKMPAHSAYRSSLVVETFKDRGGRYKGAKPKDGLIRWHKEDWRTEKGKKHIRRAEPSSDRPNEYLKPHLLRWES